MKALILLWPLSALAASGPPDLSVRQLVWYFFVLLGVAVIFGLIHYAVKTAPFITEPFKSVLLWIIVLAGILLAIYIILGLIGL
jgi:hypothetical protein